MNALHKTPTGTENGTSSVPTRDQINIADTWDLSSLFPTPKAYDEAFKDLDSLANWSAKVGKPFREVALVEIVGTDPVHHEFMNQRAHDARAVVDARQQDRLVTQGDAGIGQLCHTHRLSDQHVGLWTGGL